MERKTWREGGKEAGKTEERRHDQHEPQKVSFTTREPQPSADP